MIIEEIRAGSPADERTLKMLYITGDMHGDENRISKQRLSMLHKGDTLLICGDFGFLWDDSAKERAVRKKLEKREYTICFVDGTHENFQLLNDCPLVDWNGGKAHRLQANIYHLLRGQMYTIDGKTVFTMGGGENPEADILEDTLSANDKAAIPTDQELLDGVNRMEKAGFRCDYIVTHEPPSKIKEFLMLGENATLRVTALSAYFDELQTQCSYRHWYFGSMHLDKFISGRQTAVFRTIVNAETGERY